jgi:hypothetical protein
MIAEVRTTPSTTDLLEGGIDEIVCDFVRLGCNRQPLKAIRDFNPFLPIHGFSPTDARYERVAGVMSAPE